MYVVRIVHSPFSSSSKAKSHNLHFNIPDASCQATGFYFLTVIKIFLIKKVFRFQLLSLKDWTAGL